MYKNILLATDFDEVGVNAAKKAIKIAQDNQASLHLVHVIEPVPAYAYPGFAGFTDIEASLRDTAKNKLQELAKTLDVTDEFVHLCAGQTKQEVLRVAEELKADLIIAGSHGKHGLSLLLGSTADAILHGAKCDVLILRASEKS